MSSLNPSAVLGHRGKLSNMILLFKLVPHDQGDTATCQPIPHEEGTQEGLRGFCQSSGPAVPSLLSLPG